ncbi:MAG: 50S ribosomal protein L10 [Epsilonproteobacteria bacterium]|nr:50S ribosomal protein L10 [Campylobacterota bacterium]
MNREQKKAIVSEVHDKFVQSQASFLVNYKGLDVASMQNLRTQLREDNAQLKVTKATLMKIAAQDIEGIQDFANSFNEQVGLVFANDDSIAIAKKLVKFSKDNDALQVIAGFFESRSLSKDEVEFLASLPSKEILLAQLLGTMQAPISGLARSLNAIIAQLAYALNQIAEKKS